MALTQKRNAKGELMIAITGHGELPDDPNLYHTLADYEASANELIESAELMEGRTIGQLADRVWAKYRAKHGGAK